MSAPSSRMLWTLSRPSAKKPVEEERNKVIHLKDELNKSQTTIFPNLSVDLDIGLGKIEIDLTAQLIEQFRSAFHRLG